MILDGASEMFDFIKKRLKRKTKPAAAAPTAPAAEKSAPRRTARELATDRGEPWVEIIKMDIDPNNLHQGSFELDWNEVFVARLVKAGYMAKPTDTDAEIVDRWFQNVCRHVVMETWEQEEAIRKSGIYVQTRDIGNGRSEVS